MLPTAFGARMDEDKDVAAAWGEVGLGVRVQCEKPVGLGGRGSFGSEGVHELGRGGEAHGSQSSQ